MQEPIEASGLGVLAEGMGMQILFHDIEEKLPLGNSRAASNLADLLSNSDLVSLHVPQTAETANMIGADELAQMKPGAFLINASRGNVVVIDALAAALKSGHLRGAAVDVFPVEPKSNKESFVSPLQGMDNVILTPHVGGSTLEAQQNIAQEVTNKLIKYSDNGSTLSAVNFPQVSMPDLGGCHRILHIHRNEPGVLQQINDIFARHRINVAAQYLQTQDRIGYVVMDLELEDAYPVIEELRAVPTTIRTRILY
jgi:D-3-phosphoglycerate dehydrogenase